MWCHHSQYQKSNNRMTRHEPILLPPLLPWSMRVLVGAGAKHYQVLVDCVLMLMGLGLGVRTEVMRLNPVDPGLGEPDHSKLLEALQQTLDWFANLLMDMVARCKPACPLLDNLQQGGFPTYSGVHPEEAQDDLQRWLVQNDQIPQIWQMIQNATPMVSSRLKPVDPKVFDGESSNWADYFVMFEIVTDLNGLDNGQWCLAIGTLYETGRWCCWLCNKGAGTCIEVYISFSTWPMKSCAA